MQKTDCHIPILVLTPEEILVSINKDRAHRFVDGIFWLKGGEWTHAGWVHQYAQDIRSKMYHFEKSFWYVESGVVFRNWAAFSLFSHRQCPLYTKARLRCFQNRRKNKRNSKKWQIISKENKPIFVAHFHQQSSPTHLGKQTSLHHIDAIVP